MSKKRIKKRLLVWSLSSLAIAVPAISLISADPKPEEPNKPTKPGGDTVEIAPPNEKIERTISPEFDTFVSRVEDRVPLGFATGIDEAIAFFEKESQKAREDKEMDFKLRIEKILYYQNLISFLKRNKNNYIKDPKSVGANVIFPYVIAKNKVYDVGSITFNNKNFDNVVIGKTKETNYSTILGENDSFKIERDEKNVTSLPELISAVESYAKAIANEFKKLIFDEKEDLLKIDTDVGINVGNENEPKQPEDAENTSDETPKPKNNLDNVIGISAPNGFKTWDEYFINKLSKRFSEFDLEQNQEFLRKIEENKKPTPPPPEEPKGPETEAEPLPLPPPPPLPPLIPEEELVDTEVPLLNVTSLVPQVKYTKSLLSKAELVNAFNANNNTNKSDEFFYFDNPINTRFNYVVTHLSLESDKVVASVELNDKNAPDAKRTYKANLNIVNDVPTQKFNAVYEAQMLGIRNDLFVKFYKAVGLDEKINYNDLRSKVQQNTLFSMVNFANIIYSTDFATKMKEIAKAYANVLTNANLEQTLQEASYRAKYEFLNELGAKRVNDRLFWNAWHEGNNANLTLLENNIKRNKEPYEQAFSKLNLSANTINNLYYLAKKDNQKLLAKMNAKPFDLLKGYDEMVAMTSKVNEELTTISLNLNYVSSQKEEDVTKAKEAYTQAQSLLASANTSQNTFMNVFGGILLALSLIGLITTLVIGLRYLKNKNKTLFKTMIVLAVVFAIVIVVAIALIAVGI